MVQMQQSHVGIKTQLDRLPLVTVQLCGAPRWGQKEGLSSGSGPSAAGSHPVHGTLFAGPVHDPWLDRTEV